MSSRSSSPHNESGANKLQTAPGQVERIRPFLNAGRVSRTSERYIVIGNRSRRTGSGSSGRGRSGSANSNGSGVWGAAIAFFLRPPPGRTVRADSQAVGRNAQFLPHFAIPSREAVGA